jgi:uncharacterized 2Fe-2S/4Fe-4S cluster protein (DUF4445 family)
MAGPVSAPADAERAALSAQELAEGYRLACQTYARGDCKLRVLPESLTALQRAQVEGLAPMVPTEPLVSTYQVTLAPPSIADPRSDDLRLQEALRLQHGVESHGIDIEVLRRLSPQLRTPDWQKQASVRAGEVIAVSPWRGRSLGLAVDLGTTKIAGYLVDLQSGQTLAARGIMNPQIAYGEDVVSRIALALKGIAEAARLRELAAGALNQLADELCAEVDRGPETIFETVVVGNTAMHHLLLGLPVAQLAFAPYVPVVRQALDIKARDIGLRIAPGAYVHLLPNIAGFVGADHVAMLLATGVAQAADVTLALDIGTNTEICLIQSGKMTSVSCASGPAFEGAHIRHGMRAASGAIERLQLDGDRVTYQTIGGRPPAGLCGSGILDAIAQLYLAGVLDRRGTLREHPRTRGHGARREFVLVDEAEGDGRPAIAITQHDVREIQLAKAAIRTGVDLLLARYGLAATAIEQVIIAGAFGTYLDVSSAVAIGMLPQLPRERFRQVGNAAGAGARLALVSQSQRAEARLIGERVNYLELAADPQFSSTFTQATWLG